MKLPGTSLLASFDCESGGSKLVSFYHISGDGAVRNWARAGMYQQKQGCPVSSFQVTCTLVACMLRAGCAGLGCAGFRCGLLLLLGAAATWCPCWGRCWALLLALTHCAPAINEDSLYCAQVTFFFWMTTRISSADKFRVFAPHSSSILYLRRTDPLAKASYCLS
jgi:hypothetical protein